MPNAQIERLLQINLLAPLVLTKYVVRRLMSSVGIEHIDDILEDLDQALAAATSR